MIMEIEKQSDTIDHSEGTFNRAWFWIFYILGTICSLFSFLLAQAPRGYNTNYVPDYICWSVSVCLLLLSIIKVSKAWNIKNKEMLRSIPDFDRFFVVAAFLEILFCIYGIASFL
jgi:hypothetical protein